MLWSTQKSKVLAHTLWIYILVMGIMFSHCTEAFSCTQTAYSVAKIFLEKIILIGKLLSCFMVIIAIQLLSCVWLFVNPWTTLYCSSRTVECSPTLSFTISQNLLKLASFESVMPSNCFILCCRILLMPSVFPIIRTFSSGLALHIRWPEGWCFCISPFIEYSGLIFFRID